MSDILSELLAQEEELQFEQFNEDTAWELGGLLVETARAENLPVTVDITLGTHQLFHSARPGTSADNDEWVKRKVNLVNRMGHSSFYLGQLLKSKGTCIMDAWLIPESDFAPHGGCFPIIIRGTGVVGTITVSGLAQEDDHALVVRIMREYLAK
ncbi:heme-degrading domain-containing protein [Candidatus Latescibacterota bacterium]